MKARIWCEVICDHCGAMVGHFYRNAQTIQRLKGETTDWKEIDGVNVCGDCIKRMEAGN